MNEANTKALRDAAPNLYSYDRFWGFECGDGWFELLLELSKQLEPWGVQATQVKEKFGGLRFYVTESRDEIEDLIRKAERKAKETCGMCGKPGKINASNGWLAARCEECK